MKNLFAYTTLAIGLLGGASMAHAKDVTITGYSLPDNAAYGAGSVDGYSYYDGPINMQTAKGDFVAYCADLNHELGSAVYHYGLLTENGAGTMLTELQSYRIGSLATYGIGLTSGLVQDVAAQDKEAAVQLAIWAIEYNTSASNFASNAIKNDYTADMLQYLNPSASQLRWAEAITPVGNWPANGGLSQQMVVGMSSAVPEPSTWAMGVAGFVFLGFVGARKRRQSLAIA